MIFELDALDNQWAIFINETRAYELKMVRSVWEEKDSPMQIFVSILYDQNEIVVANETPANA